MISALPESGAGSRTPKGPSGNGPRSVQQGELNLAVSLAAEFRTEVGRPQPVLADLLLKRA